MKRRHSPVRPKVRRSPATHRSLQLESLERRDLFATLTVTGPSLIIDGDTSSISKLLANPGADGLISLREAVIAANNTAGTDRIEFSSSLDDAAVNGRQLNITDDLIIQGNGRDKTELNGGSGGSSIFTVQKGVALTIGDVTIKQGKAQKGGAIDNSGTTTLTNAILTANRADDAGGAIYNRPDATLLIVDSSLEFNATLRANSAFYKGGAIYNVAGNVVIVTSTIRNNGSGRGGGVYSESLYKSDGSVSKTGSVTIRESVFESNSAGDDGAGLFNFGEARVLNSLFVGNSAPNSSGGAIANAGQLSLSNSTLTANEADHGAGLMSGNILAGVNVAATIENGTIVENDGHGIYQTTGVVALSNTILAGNDSADYRMSNAFGTMRSEGYNLIGSTENAAGGNILFHVSDLRNIEPLLGPLSDNGGPTRTLSPLPGSPAIDGGDPDFEGPLYDQRGIGFERVRNGRVDIGAVESIGVTREVLEVTLAAVDAQGNAISSVGKGQEFYLQVIVADLRDDPLGVYGVYVDLQYDPELLQVSGATEFPGVFVNGVSAGLSTEGLIDEVGAFSASLSPLSGEPQVFISVPFVAAADGVARFAVNAADVMPANETLLYGRNSPVREGEVRWGTLDLTVSDDQPPCVSWQNCANRFDVNNDGVVTPLDAMIVINRLNLDDPSELPDLESGDPPPAEYLDVSGDGHVTPIDALLVINYLNSAPADAEGEGEEEAAVILASFNDSMPRTSPPPSLASIRPKPSLVFVPEIALDDFVVLNKPSYNSVEASSVLAEDEWGPIFAGVDDALLDQLVR